MAVESLVADLIHKVLNLVVPPLSIATLLFLLPPYLFFKSLLSLINSIFSENVAGKVVLITGASSGIGEHLAYVYASRGACLALVARRESRLVEVANRAYWLGSPDVIVIRADVSKVDDCKRFVDETVSHFGRLDHLVNNAGIAPVSRFEDCHDVTKLAPSMDINFWGSAYSSYFAIPHLRQSGGRIVAIASAASWLPVPRLSFYSASKAAVVAFYETLRTELGSDVSITIVTPGLIESEMTQGKFLSEDGVMILDPELRDVEVSLMPIRSVKVAAEKIVNGACRGDGYLSEPGWIKASMYWKVFCPEILEWSNRLLLLSRSTEDPERNAISKEILDWSGLKQYLYPTSVQYPDLLAHKGLSLDD
ncbi:11-beta-hydroxysteroid dehydrogenase 1B-like [Punica granatum]|uniref:11-beta-hydroxysteroid dehydrogenase 1B-like n=1 Tax=Punica granatum TaxID=22663 RepID=A0A218W7X3_PUNGR|nr:11-beta-hydroxysteroid dehydrogenase 1B-like [Punica granatum]OWM68643.1 hypothetical protein CDL15_Pgr023608 [Punica granatum]